MIALIHWQFTTKVSRKRFMKRNTILKKKHVLYKGAISKGKDRLPPSNHNFKGGVCSHCYSRWPKKGFQVRPEKPPFHLTKKPWILRLTWLHRQRKQGSGGLAQGWWWTAVGDSCCIWPKRNNPFKCCWYNMIHTIYWTLLVLVHEVIGVILLMDKILHHLGWLKPY